MNQERLNKFFAAGVFLLSLITYLLTVQPSVSFWDCGEFIASAFLMQVPHPPGTPFFLLIGKLFSMIPFAENIAYRVNMVSVFSGAFTIMFLYLSAVRVINNFRKDDNPTPIENLGTYLAAAIGALSLAFSDTFWFNAVEAEVYALSTFLIAFIVWLIVVWNDNADKVDNEKYLIMIAYLLGISTGVHLMAVLGIVPVVMIIMFKKYIQDDQKLLDSGKIFVLHSVIILIAAAFLWASQTNSNGPSPEVYKAFDMKFLMIMAAITAGIFIIFRKKIFHWDSFYLPLAIGGVTLIAIYPGMVKYVPKLISTISGADYTMNIVVFAAIMAGIGFLVYWSKKENKQTTHLVAQCILFALLGFSSYASIPIRSNQDTPINLNSPKTFPELVSYLNREQYGDFPTFQRRFTGESHQQIVYNNYSSDFDFFASYQMNHMFNRYLLWNYVGRTSTVQDAGIDITKYFAIPFLLGLFGLYYHFRKDWKTASAFLVMFIFLGFLTAFYQNQQQPQPRERDYFYVGAFFIFSLWIALGMKGLVELFTTAFKESNMVKPISYGLLGIGLLVVPINMLRVNYFEHDRSKNYVPWDYSYNLLQSAAENSIIFTNGDNDTFPLWYLQDVEGVRRDVRIANLSLLNTPWYILQLKNTAPHGAAKIKMNLSDAQINRLEGVQRFDPTKIVMPVSPEVYSEFGITDTAITNRGKIEWTMPNTLQFGDIKAIRVQDIVALDLIRANQWERPIYFAVTSSEKSQLGLNDYMRMEGLSYRLTPTKKANYYAGVNAEIMEQQLLHEPDGYSKTYQPGFKFRGLDDPNIFFDENHSRLTINYRNSYLRLAIYYLNYKKDTEKCLEVLDKMEENMPRKILPISSYLLENDIAGIYFDAGDMDTYREYAMDVEASALRDLEANPTNFSSQYNPYQILLGIYNNLKDYDKAIDILMRLQKYVPNDPQLKAMLNQYRKLANADTTEVTKNNIIN